MKLSEFKIIDRTLFLEKEKTLVIGDLHLGYENFLHEKGWSFPKVQLEDTLKLLKKIFSKTGKLNKIILLGDVKHYFAGVLNEEWNDFNEVMELFYKHLNEKGKVIITKGNHDSILEPVVRNYKKVDLVDFFESKGILFFHGDYYSEKRINIELHKKNVNSIVIGHFHPAISLSDGVKSETYKCFLKGESKKYNKGLIILPSFFPLTEGSDVLTSIEFKKQDIDNFDVFVLDEKGEIYDFGKIKELKINLE